MGVIQGMKVNKGTVSIAYLVYGKKYLRYKNRKEALVFYDVAVLDNSHMQRRHKGHAYSTGGVFLHKSTLA